MPAQNPEKKKEAAFEITPGELYRGIKITREEFAAGERVLVRRKIPRFVSFCRSIHARFPSLGAGAKFKQQYRDAVEFLGWDLKAEEFASASKLSLFIFLLLGVVLGTIIYLSPISGILESFLGMAMLVPIFIFAPFILLGLAATTYIQQYPLNAARIEETRALTYVPEIIGYMIMSMKLVPNLEKAVEFAAEHGSGKIADDFKRLLWDVQLGVYSTLSEALDALAYRWGKFSEEFKHALMMIRASVLENTEAKRFQLLDKTMTTILESIRNKMEDYARNLSQPSIMLFYLGVLLPLILIIVLPVGSAFSGQPLAMPVVLVAIYNIVIPITTIWFAHSVIQRRPPTYKSPVIPDDFPGLPKKWKMQFGKSFVDVRFVMAIVLVAGLLGSYFLHMEGLPPASMLPREASQILPKDKTIAEIMAVEGKPPNWFDDGGPYEQSFIQREGATRGRESFIMARIMFFSRPENDITPYNLIFGIMLTFVGCIAVLLHYASIYKRRVQLSIGKMETEFKDSLYVLASRLGENKPVEEAIKHTRDFLPDFEISSRIFGKTSENIELLGMPVDSAVFDPNYGALRHMPSQIIQTGMRIMVDSVKLGVNFAARTLISLSLQLRNSEKVNRMLFTLIADTTSMMKSMAVFITPIVLGVTTALQKVVMLTLSSIYSSNAARAFVETTASDIAGVPGGIAGMGQIFVIDANAFNAMAKPWEFLLIVGIYVIELVIIMTYFTTKIQEDNNLLFKINLARTLPIAVAIFLVAVIASSVIVGGFFG